MTTETRFSRTLTIAFAMLMVSALLLTPAYAQGPKAQPLGLESPSKTMTVSVMLNLHNQAGLDAFVKSLHDKNSPNYKKPLTLAGFTQSYAPTAGESKQVQDYLKSNGLTVLRTDKNNLSITAVGNVATIEKTFNTQIGRFQLGADTIDKPMQAPTMSPAISSLVKHVSLGSVKAHPYNIRQIDPKTKKPVAAVKYSKTKKFGLFFPGDCFSVSNTVYNLTGPGLQGTYSGNGYPASGCGYSAAELQHAYGFDTVISGGIDGTGEIIVILDAYGSATITQDAQTYSAANSLPAIVPGTNFFIVDNPNGGPPDCVVSPGVQCGWEGEVTLDVELAHAMAPGATIVLVTNPTQQFQDFWLNDLWIAENVPAASVSHSYGAPESEVFDFDFPDYDAQYTVNEIADSLGLAYNYSSGDSGDFYPFGDYFPYTDVSFPSGSPNAASVGGTSLALTSAGGYKWENGWGTNATWLNFAPPLNFGFQYGAGGGTSSVTGAPAWQNFFLGNIARQQPDVAFTADPFTGAEIIITPDSVPGDPQFVEVIGGTSLACPMFSAVWALVIEKTGTPGIGNAAPWIGDLFYNVPGSLHDVQPVGSGHNSHGTIFYGNSPVSYSQWDLAQPYQNSLVFYEAFWNPGNLYTITFGTDSSLTTNPGWDNVTGWGTPNGATFIAPF